MLRRVLAAGLVVGALVSGCGSGPSQVGAAAIVGSDVVTLEQVQERIRTALSPEKREALGITDASAERQVVAEIVTQAVRGELIAQGAAVEGVAVGEADVDAVITARGGVDAIAAQSVYGAADVRRTVRDDLLAAAIGRRYVDRLSVRFDATTAQNEAEAQRERALIAAGGPQADALFSGPTDRRDTVASASSNPSVLAFVGGVPAGSLMILRPQQPGDAWTLVRVTERRTDLPAPSGGSVADSLGEQFLQELGVQVLKPLADDLGVRPNPRYGVWDEVAMAVIDESSVIGEIVPIPATP